MLRSTTQGITHHCQAGEAKSRNTCLCHEPFQTMHAAGSPVYYRLHSHPHHTSSKAPVVAYS